MTHAERKTCATALRFPRSQTIHRGGSRAPRAAAALDHTARRPRFPRTAFDCFNLGCDVGFWRSPPRAPAMMVVSGCSAGVPPRSYAADVMLSRKRKRPASASSAVGRRQPDPERTDPPRAATSHAHALSLSLALSGPRGSTAAATVITAPLPAESIANAGKLPPLTPTVAPDGLPWPAGQDPAARWGAAGERRKLHTNDDDDHHATAATAMDVYEPHLEGMPAAVLAAIASRLTTRDLLAMARVSLGIRGLLLAVPGVWANIAIPHTAASLLSDADLSMLLGRAASMPRSLDLRGCAELDGRALAGLVSLASSQTRNPLPPRFSRYQLGSHGPHDRAIDRAVRSVGGGRACHTGAFSTRT